MITTAPMLNQFGPAVRAARKDAGLTQVQLSERLGMNQSYLSKIERGERAAPSLANALRLAHYFVNHHGDTRPLDVLVGRVA